MTYGRFRSDTRFQVPTGLFIMSSKSFTRPSNICHTSRISVRRASRLPRSCSTTTVTSVIFMFNACHVTSVALMFIHNCHICRICVQQMPRLLRSCSTTTVSSDVFMFNKRNICRVHVHQRLSHLS